jgi:fatty acid desaturase
MQIDHDPRERRNFASFFDVLVWATGIGLAGYLKFHYGHELGVWLMSLVK